MDGQALLALFEHERLARRSAIEPVIGHLKNDYRMARGFLKGAHGASENLHLAAAACNLQKWWKHFVLCLIGCRSAERFKQTGGLLCFEKNISAA